MGQDFSSTGNYLKIKEIDHVRVEITNMGDKVVLLSYHGIDKELKQGESVIMLKIVLGELNAKNL